MDSSGNRVVSTAYQKNDFEKKRSTETSKQVNNNKSTELSRQVIKPPGAPTPINDMHQSVCNVLYAQLIDFSDSQLDKNQVD